MLLASSSRAERIQHVVPPEVDHPTFGEIVSDGTQLNPGIPDNCRVFETDVESVCGCNVHSRGSLG